MPFPSPISFVRDSHFVAWSVRFRCGPPACSPPGLTRPEQPFGPPGLPGLFLSGFQVTGPPRVPVGYHHRAKLRVAPAGLSPASTAASLAAPPARLSTAVSCRNRGQASIACGLLAERAALLPHEEPGWDLETRRRKTPRWHDGQSIARPTTVRQIFVNSSAVLGTQDTASPTKSISGPDFAESVRRNAKYRESGD